MGVLIKNANVSISLSLTALRLVGFWAPEGLNKFEKILYYCYGVLVFMFILGTYLIIQAVDLFLIWGNLPLMTGTAFLMFTNLAQAAKIINLLIRRQVIQQVIEEADGVLMRVETEEAKEIVKRENSIFSSRNFKQREMCAPNGSVALRMSLYGLLFKCDRETTLQQRLYLIITIITGIGWATSAEKQQLPLRAWYPYDTSKSPAYELTYFHQVSALFVAATLNVGKDTLVTALIAQCRCRLRLLALSLNTLCRQMQLNDQRLTPDQEATASVRLRACVTEHRAALQAAAQLQASFSEPTFAQFNVSLIIICVTAFQLVSMTGNLVRLLSMGTYLLNMMFQVFIYCYQGTQLSEESSEIAGAVYQCPWYLCSVELRRALLMVMVRSRRVARLKAGGFTTLSLASFMAIIKASYSLFTLLQQVEEKI